MDKYFNIGDSTEFLHSVGAEDQIIRRHCHADFSVCAEELSSRDFITAKVKRAGIYLKFKWFRWNLFDALAYLKAAQ